MTIARKEMDRIVITSPVCNAQNKTCEGILPMTPPSPFEGVYYPGSPYFLQPPSSCPAELSLQLL